LALAKAELENIRNSTSLKVGLALTAPLRAVKTRRRRQAVDDKTQP
jgi:hypothetical protein